MMMKDSIIDNMRVASPCPVGWEKMSGDERVRFCAECRLHVYNISEMTSQQVRSLIQQNEGRLCVRLYRRADGTVLTRDCPVGLKALRKRVARVAGAALTALLSIGATAFGQNPSQEDKSCTLPGSMKIKREAAQGNQATLTGIILDQTGAVLPGAEISLTDAHNKKRLTALTTDEGKFTLSAVPAGRYAVEIKATGFAAYKLKELEIGADEVLKVEATLDVDGEFTVGILTDMSPIEDSNGGTIWTRDKILRLPLP